MSSVTNISKSEFIFIEIFNLIIKLNTSASPSFYFYQGWRFSGIWRYVALYFPDVVKENGFFAVKMSACTLNSTMKTMLFFEMLVAVRPAILCHVQKTGMVIITTLPVFLTVSLCTWNVSLFPNLRFARKDSTLFKPEVILYYPALGTTVTYLLRAG